MTPLLPYATWEDQYVRTPGKIDYQELAKTWNVTHEHLVRSVYQKRLSVERQKYWDEIYGKARKAAHRKLESLFSDMVEDLSTRRDALRAQLAQPEIEANATARVSDALGNVARDILRAKGVPPEEPQGEQHNLYAKQEDPVPHPEND